MSDRQPPLPNRQTPFSDAFKAFIAAGWAPPPRTMPELLPAAAAAGARRAEISRQFPGDRLVIGAGGFKVRSNDTDYRFRPHSAFAHLTGLGTDQEPDAVLVLEPSDDGHEATLYARPPATPESEEFYANARYGELWVGRRPSLHALGAQCGIDCRDTADLPDQLRKNAATVGVRVLHDDLPAEVRGALAEVRGTDGLTAERDSALVVALSELRLIKDAFEVEQLRQACAATAEAFAAVVAGLPEAVRSQRGERWVEGVFGLHARHVGNAVGYDTIAASGEHACTLHWIRNDGDLHDGDLLLLDAGIELDTLYTADITRTLPVNGRFSPEQRRVYDAVLAAQQAGLDAARPGVTFTDVHKAAVAVLAHRLADWGLLPVTAEESLSPDGGQHRRWMVHGTSHHLGLDVHDCAQARTENYREGVLRPGMVITVEPGLYFRSDDLLVPEELRGIGVRIEDDIVITDDGCEILSSQLPRSAEDVEAWIADVWAGAAATA